MRIPSSDQVVNYRQSIRNRVLGNHFAVRANPFTERYEVRGGEQPGAISLRATDGIDHGTNRTFAVCAGDVNDLECRGALRGERRAFDTNAATTFVEQAPNIF